MSTPHFEDFWTASAITPANRQAFFDRIAAYVPAEPAQDPWSRPSPPQSAERLDGSFAELIDQRRSVRAFSAEPLEDRDLGRLLSVLAEGTSGRPNPAAGGLNTIRGITLTWPTDRGPGRVLQHDPVVHMLTPVGGCPAWADLIDDLGGADAITPPAAVVGLFADTRALLAKYGERGGRFALLEAGAALQNLSLAAAALGLVGYPMGGAVDARMLHLAGLTGTDDASGADEDHERIVAPGAARYVVGYAVGNPA
ncbi:nitroreductase family protein [Ruania halotolerans]|uniref:nitroreductase family protein n=1 Tax=Ruania halotolerans TaxID=2897773 RepID=UPI001E47987B|nr:nitroreductase family protein [Ruania halotolerans]UFU07068.1 nitroreductase family protein [Ruania halotolerans]